MGLRCLAINVVGNFVYVDTALIRQVVKDIVSFGCFFASLLVSKDEINPIMEVVRNII